MTTAGLDLLFRTKPAYRFTPERAFVGTRCFGKGINIGLRWVACLPLRDESLKSITAANEVTQRILSVFIWPLFIDSALKFGKAGLKFKSSKISTSAWRLMRSGSMLQKRIFEVSLWLYYSRILIISSSSFIALQQAYCLSYLAAEGLRGTSTILKLKKLTHIHPESQHQESSLSQRKFVSLLKLADSITSIAALTLVGIPLFLGVPAYPFLKLLLSTLGLALKSTRYCNSLTK